MGKYRYEFSDNSCNKWSLCRLWACWVFWRRWWIGVKFGRADGSFRRDRRSSRIVIHIRRRRRRQRWAGRQRGKWWPSKCIIVGRRRRRRWRGKYNGGAGWANLCWGSWWRRSIRDCGWRGIDSIKRCCSRDEWQRWWRWFHYDKFSWSSRKHIPGIGMGLSGHLWPRRWVWRRRWADWRRELQRNLWGRRRRQAGRCRGRWRCINCYNSIKENHVEYSYRSRAIPIRDCGTTRCFPRACGDRPFASRRFRFYKPLTIGL